jgi:hypothetical protein
MFTLIVLDRGWQLVTWIRIEAVPPGQTKLRISPRHLGSQHGSGISQLLHPVGCWLPQRLHCLFASPLMTGFMATAALAISPSDRK